MSLSKNTASLSAILAAANALSEGSGGGGGATFLEGTFTMSSPFSGRYAIATLPKEPKFAFMEIMGLYDPWTPGLISTFATGTNKYTTYCTGDAFSRTDIAQSVSMTNRSGFTLFYEANDSTLYYTGDSSSALNGEYHWGVFY